MSSKSKIVILPALALLLTAVWALAGGPARAEGESGGDLVSFSNNAQLRDAIWKLAAFVPTDGNGGKRTLRVDNIKGLPPVFISLTYGEPLDPWPLSLELVFQAESTSPPVFFVIRDKRPFGAKNIELNGSLPDPAGLREAEKPQALLLDLLQNLNSRLLGGRPRLASFQWSEAGSGAESARTKILYGARLGPDDLFLLRFSPDLFTFKPYHESEYPSAGSNSISGWADILPEAVAIVNGGQYYPDRSYMGSLSRGGTAMSAGPHRQWKGFVVSEPKAGAPEGLPAAAVIDLEEAGRGLKPEHYRNVMQSFMLLDHKGLIRVRESRNLAGRTALGEDREGRLVLIMTPAAISLYELATVLKSPSLGLTRVMAFDGGFEAQMFMRRNGAGFAAGGQFSISDSKAVYIPGYRASLPAVLAVEPLSSTPALNDDSRKVDSSIGAEFFSGNQGPVSEE